MDVVVEVGRGYRPVDETVSHKNINMIALDAIFSPVMQVHYLKLRTLVSAK